MGSLILAESGFNVHNAPPALKVLDTRSGVVVEFTSTHPNAENRAAHVEASMSDLMRVYEENKAPFEGRKQIFKCKIRSFARRAPGEEELEFELVV